MIAINYWVGFFAPIAHKQLKEKYGYKVVYVDTMAGSGVTETKRERDCLCGSCPGAAISASKRGFPFDKIIGIEIDSKKANALRSRLGLLNPNQEISIYDKDILDVSRDIAEEIGRNSVSYIVIDPQGFRGMTWTAIGPLLLCKGDAMVTWFEDSAWRMKEAACSSARSSEGLSNRLTELLSSEEWRNATKPSNLTDLFIQRVIDDTSKKAHRIIDVKDVQGKHYKMILFVGRFRNADSLAEKWKIEMERRLGSSKGKRIGRLLDKNAKRNTDLRDWLK